MTYIPYLNILSFIESENVSLPEAIVNDWIDRLTIRTFNDDLKSIK